MNSADWVWEDRRLNDREVAADAERLRRLAKEFLYGYDGENPFLLSVQENSLHRMTVRQVRGVLNCARQDPRGRMLLERGPDTKQAREPEAKREFVHEECPLMGQEHGRHWFPLRTRSGSQHCIGWHAMRRDITRTPARFHKDYLRGKGSTRAG
jgi:hypothetical protein